jgi:hypothetical protein
MTAKFVVMNAMVKETRQRAGTHGRVQTSEHAGNAARVYGVTQKILASPQTLLTLGIMLVMSIAQMINGTFWSIYVTEKLHIPTQHLALYPFARSIALCWHFSLPSCRRSGS